ncbi:heme-binding protein [Sinomonas sp. G460-2]|uniref:heme-binding protein n=1 Tax=Sinomonas sp. G460-2 TaxID=3393464 RepID=UPI0039EF88C2
MTETNQADHSTDYDKAWDAGSKIVDKCRREGLPITIGIWLGDQRVFHAALAGSSADNDSWVERKANTVRRFRCSSKEVQERFGDMGVDFFTLFGLSAQEYTPAAGGVPIVSGSSMIGVVAVSGLEGTGDHYLASLTLDLLRLDE